MAENSRTSMWENKLLWKWVTGLLALLLIGSIFFRPINHNLNLYYPLVPWFLTYFLILAGILTLSSLVKISLVKKSSFWLMLFFLFFALEYIIFVRFFPDYKQAGGYLAISWLAIWPIYTVLGFILKKIKGISRASDVDNPSMFNKIFYQDLDARKVFKIVSSFVWFLVAVYCFIGVFFRGWDWSITALFDH